MMPTVLLAAAAFWGAATGRPVAALLLAVVVEGVRLVTARWEFGRKEFERVADLVSVALVVLLAWQWFGSRHAGEAIVATFTWLPWILAPLVAMQRLDAVGAVPLTAFFWSMRGARMPTDEDRRIDLAPPFAWVCIVSGACANPRGPWIAAAGVFAVSGAGLLSTRVKSDASRPMALDEGPGISRPAGADVFDAPLPERPGARVMDRLADARMRAYRDRVLLYGAARRAR